MKASLFIGRWQPPHNGHMYIIKKALDEGKNVAIGLRDTPVGPNDPYTIAERMDMFHAIFKEMGIEKARYELVIMPDIESVNIGRKVGYGVIRYDSPADIEGISATSIRVAMENNDDTWKQKVPMAVADILSGDVVRKRGRVVWLTGLPCSGKTTIADRFGGPMTAHLDGDVVRTGLCEGLGFSKDGRDENLRRVAHVAALMADTGMTVMCSFVSPRKSQRDMVREIVGATRFKLVHVHCSATECARRDVKGMWAKAEAGEIKGFTGHDAPYEVPGDDDLTLCTDEESIDESTEKLFTLLFSSK